MPETGPSVWLFGCPFLSPSLYLGRSLAHGIMSVMFMYACMYV